MSEVVIWLNKCFLIPDFTWELWTKASVIAFGNHFCHLTRCRANVSFSKAFMNACLSTAWRKLLCITYLIKNWTAYGDPCNNIFVALGMSSIFHLTWGNFSHQWCSLAMHGDLSHWQYCWIGCFRHAYMQTVVVGIYETMCCEYFQKRNGFRTSQRIKTAYQIRWDCLLCNYAFHTLLWLGRNIYILILYIWYH